MTTGHLPSRHPAVVSFFVSVRTIKSYHHHLRGACRGGLCRRGGRLQGGLPGVARPRQRVDARRSSVCACPLPRAGAKFAVRVSAGGLPLRGLTRGCLRESPGGRPHDVAAHSGCPQVDARRKLRAGFRQCGSFVEVYVVDCALSMGGWLVLVRGGGACHAVCGGLPSGAALVDVRLDVVPLPPSSSSQTVTGCLLGGYPAGRDWWGGEHFVGGVLSRINISADVWVFMKAGARLL
jgi:hypothetical protein